MSGRLSAVAYRSVAYYEILAAAWSATVTYNGLARSNVRIPWPWALLILAALTLVGGAGAMLLRRVEVGEILTYVAQALQVPHIALGPLAFRFVAGLQASGVLSSGRVFYFVGFSTSITLWRPNAGSPSAIGVNFVPVVIIVALACLPTPQKVDPSAL